MNVSFALSQDDISKGAYCGRGWLSVPVYVFDVSIDEVRRTINNNVFCTNCSTPLNTSANVTPCPNRGCRSMYCSPRCLDRDRCENGHFFLCCGWHDNIRFSLTQEFISYARANSIHIVLALKVLAKLINKVCLACFDGGHTASLIRSHFASILSEFVESSLICGSDEFVIHDSYSMLRAILLHEKNCIHRSSVALAERRGDSLASMTTLEVGEDIVAVLTIDLWKSLLGTVSANLIAIHMESQLAPLARSLPTLSSLLERRQVMRRIEEEAGLPVLVNRITTSTTSAETTSTTSLSDVMTPTTCSASVLQSSSNADADVGVDVDSIPSRNMCAPSQKLQMARQDGAVLSTSHLLIDFNATLMQEERHMCRLAQAAGVLNSEPQDPRNHAGSDILSVSRNPFDRLAFTANAVLSPGYRLPHSCIPNVTFEACRVAGRGCDDACDDAHRRHSSNNGTLELKTASERRDEGDTTLCMRLVALRDIKEGEPLSLSYIDYSASSTVLSRREALTLRRMVVSKDDDESNGGTDVTEIRNTDSSRMANSSHCFCLRCRAESSPKELALILEAMKPAEMRQLKAIGDLYMQGLEYSRATRLYCRIVLRLIQFSDNNKRRNGCDNSCGDNGDVERERLLGDCLHAIFAAIIGDLHNRSDRAEEEEEKKKRKVSIASYHHRHKIKTRSARIDNSHSNWRVAHKLLLAACALCPVHLGLAEAAAKLRAYYQYHSVISPSYPICSLGSTAATTSHPAITGEAAAFIAQDFYSIYFPNNQRKMYARTSGGGIKRVRAYLSRWPILTRQRCSAIISAVEEHATSKDGWTTSRHYAVPTTDIPIHSIPVVLEMFNDLLKSVLCPLLVRQFACRHDDDDSARFLCHVSVHDAFVIKYVCPSSVIEEAAEIEAGTSRAYNRSQPQIQTQQRHLPLHMDESTHSFTIALNSVDDYEGGGTYFDDLGVSIRPDIGQVLSFEGDILHGGDPLLSGTRYAIAAFMLLAVVPSPPPLSAPSLSPLSVINDHGDSGDAAIDYDEMRHRQNGGDAVSMTAAVQSICKNLCGGGYEDAGYEDAGYEDAHKNGRPVLAAATVAPARTTSTDSLHCNGWGDAAAAVNSTEVGAPAGEASGTRTKRAWAEAVAVTGYNKKGQQQQQQQQRGTEEQNNKTAFSFSFGFSSSSSS